jgi:cell division protein FtsW
VSSAVSAVKIAPVSTVLPLDKPLLGLSLALLLIGFIAITSASVEYASAAPYHNPFYFSTRHAIYLVAALLASAAVFMVPLQFWLTTGWIWLFIAMALLVLVFIPGLGAEINGSRRWLRLGPVTLQASEVAKFFLVIYLAGYLLRHEVQVRSDWQGFVKPMAVVFAITVLLMSEPDFGATVVTGGMAFGMLFLAGVKLRHFLLVVVASVAGLAALLVSAPYDQFNSGYQLTQSLIAFGRGEWLGVGLGNSVQKLFYLPEAHTDFVFAIWAEETGLLGALLVVALYLALVHRIFTIARNSSRAGDLFGAHICHGIALVFAAQAFINIGVSTGLLPTKGLTLPLLSYGGSSLIVCCCMLALVLRVDLQCRIGWPKKNGR